MGELTLDDVLTGLPARAARLDGLIERATLTGGPGRPLRLFCSPVFREMVVFNPPHRQAFCIEPYTCTTDAINLQAQGVDAGWLVLDPGATWSAVVELWV
jgi:aldose 1-epimerase